jgi:hypothetical protein
MCNVRQEKIIVIPILQIDLSRPRLNLVDRLLPRFRIEIHSCEVIKLPFELRISGTARRKVETSVAVDNVLL